MSYLYGAPAEFNLKGTPYHKPNSPSDQVLYRSGVFQNPYWWAANSEYRQATNRVLVMHTLSSVLISIGTKSVSTLYSASKQVLMYIQRLMMISMSMVLWFLATRQVVA